ncbi:MAG: single-stranded DNA-binding protein [Bacilli bacterium]|nr:single-stranded DNA-binding protein [Bacilli bacterium]
MLNQTVIVGRLVRDPEVIETDNGKKVADIKLAVPRSYKNAEGDYDTDFITCVLWNGVAENTAEYCKKGDLIGIKGRIQTNKIEENGVTKDVMEVVAEKVTFLSSKKTKDEVEDGIDEEPNIEI